MSFWALSLFGELGLSHLSKESIKLRPHSSLLVPKEMSFARLVQKVCRLKIWVQVGSASKLRWCYPKLGSGPEAQT